MKKTKTKAEKRRFRSRQTLLLNIDTNTVGEHFRNIVDVIRLKFIDRKTMIRTKPRILNKITTAGMAVSDRGVLVAARIVILSKEFYRCGRILSLEIQF